MTRIIDNKSKRRLSAKLAVGLAISAMFALGTFAAPANAQPDRNRRDYHHNWTGGYYRAPPVVYGSTYGSSYYGYYGTPYYGSPYYAPPPVVYGPGLGIVIGIP
jgi:hypothetical protein